MELLIGTIISALAVAFALGVVEYFSAGKLFSLVRLFATYPMALFALWYLDFGGFSIFVCAAASSWLALTALRVVEKLSVTVVNNYSRR